MSFSKEVKEELRTHMSQVRHCQLVEAATILLYSGKMVRDSSKDYMIRIRADDGQILRKYATLFKKTFHMTPTLNEHEHEYIMEILEQKSVQDILKGTKINIEEHCERIELAPILLKNTCCKRTFIKIAYLLIGSMSDPEKGYHLEFVCITPEQARQVQHVIGYFQIETKIITRKKYYVVYLKEGTGIVELLNIMGAHVSLMKFENLRILKEMRNSVNRRVNCETANISKTVTAASKQIEDINLLIQHKELDKLPKNLIEIAMVRLEYPEASLQELGMYLQPQVGKSGVNHRLRKIGERAQLVKGDA